MLSDQYSDSILESDCADASPILGGRLNLESERLATFRYWPSDGQVCPDRLARAGFFYIGDGTDDSVQCFACRVRHSHWMTAESAMGVHEQISRNCPFVLEPRRGGGNVSLVDSELSIATTSRDASPRRVEQVSSTGASSGYQESPLGSPVTRGMSLNARLQTYANYPTNAAQTPQRLANAGFVYMGLEDRVQCPECNGQLHRWMEDDDPMHEHAQLHPACAFIRRQTLSQSRDTASPISIGIEYANAEEEDAMTEDGRINVQFVQGTSPGHDEAGSMMRAPLKKQSSGNEALKEIGVCSSVACSPYYANFEKRLETFTTWTRENPSKETMAIAGFYYLGNGDRAKCFHCNGGLQHWSDDDSPWVEHARWFPTCAYVRLCKGVEYINKCVAKQQSTEKTRLRSGSTNLIASEPSTPVTPQVQHSRAHQCVVCMDAESAVVLLPCGHLCACLQCAPPLTLCPICRKDVRAFVRAYLP